MIYFTSDLHFNHVNIIQYCNRPYHYIEEMNEALVANWNSIVTPNDTVYCLGDISLTFKPIELFSQRLNGHKYLVPGNHDWCHPSHKRSKGYKQLDMIDAYRTNGWDVLPICHSLDIEGVGKVNLSHMPYKGDATDQRFAAFRMENDGHWLLCGHVHNHWKVKDKMVNVGVDQWDMRPVSLNAIRDLIISTVNTLPAIDTSIK